MQSQDEIKLEQAAADEGSTAAAEATGQAAPPAKKVSKKKASKKKKSSKKKVSKKKSGKKKASKKKSSKKKAGKKKAGKKKAGKKKRGKKKAMAATGTPMARLLAAVDELRAAVSELASSEVSHRRKAVDEFRATAKAKISDLETAAQSSLARLTGKR